MKKIAIQIDMFLLKNKSKTTITTKGRKLLNEIIKQKLNSGTLYIDTIELQDKSNNDLAVFLQQNMIHNCVIKKIKQLKVTNNPLKDFTNRVSYSVRQIPDLTYYFDLDVADKQEELFRLGWETRNLNKEDTFNINRDSQSFSGFAESIARRTKSRYKTFETTTDTLLFNPYRKKTSTSMSAEDIKILTNEIMREELKGQTGIK